MQSREDGLSSFGYWAIIYSSGRNAFHYSDLIEADIGYMPIEALTSLAQEVTQHGYETVGSIHVYSNDDFVDGVTSADYSYATEMKRVYGWELFYIFTKENRLIQYAPDRLLSQEEYLQDIRDRIQDVDLQ